MQITELDLLAELKKMDNQEIPKGYFPRTHYEKEWNLSAAQTCKYLKKGIADGKIKMEKLRIDNFPVPHYCAV